MKTCRRCHETKPAGEFRPNRAVSDGLSSWCRACHNAAVREWRARNVDHARAVQAASDIRRRGAKLSAGGMIPTAALVALRREAAECALCRCALTQHGPCKAEVDHVVPLAIGGSNTLDNLRVVCRTCNRTRPKDGRDISQLQIAI